MRTARSARSAFTISVAMVLTISACGGGGSSNKAATNVATSTTTPSSIPSGASGGSTADNPLSLGASATLGDSSVTVVSFNPDATEQYGSSPDDGGNYAAVVLRITYNGNSSIGPESYFDVTFTDPDSGVTSDVNSNQWTLPDAAELMSKGDHKELTVFLDVAADIHPGTIAVEALYPLQQGTTTCETPGDGSCATAFWKTQDFSPATTTSVTSTTVPVVRPPALCYPGGSSTTAPVASSAGLVPCP
jgi:hypothetical protein